MYQSRTKKKEQRREKGRDQESRSVNRSRAVIEKEGRRRSGRIVDGLIKIEK